MDVAAHDDVRKALLTTSIRLCVTEMQLVSALNTISGLERRIQQIANAVSEAKTKERIQAFACEEREQLNALRDDVIAKLRKFNQALDNG